MLSDVYEDMPTGQAEALIPLLQDCLEHHGVTWRDLTAIGVGIGPGNFTGIRISVAAARGLALALDVPAVGVDMLEALALEGRTPCLAAIKAPREQVYLAGFGTRSRIDKQMCSLSSLPLDWAEPDLTCVGSGAGDVALRLEAQEGLPRFSPAEAIARITAMRWQTASGRPAPLYLKSPDAAPSRIAAPVMLDHDT